MQALKQQTIIVGQVQAVTKERYNTYGAKNIGILVKDLETREKTWVNYFFNSNQTPQYADYVRIIYSNNFQTHSITVVSREDTEF